MNPFWRIQYVWILIVLEISGAFGIMDYTAPQRHQNHQQYHQPMIHSQYSQVSMHKSQPHNYARSDHYHEPPPPRNDKLISEKDDFENLILDASNLNKKPDSGVKFNGLQCPPTLSGQFVYIMDCRQFLNCWKGRGYIQSCSPGTLFNPETKECDHPSKVKCFSSDSMENYKKLEKLVAAENNRSPKAFTSSPVPVIFSTNHPKRAECPKGASGLFEHPFDCKKFLNCANGRTFIQDCGPGTAFNPRLMVCDWIDKVDCTKYENLIDIRTNADDVELISEAESSASPVFVPNRDPKFITQSHYNENAPRPFYHRQTSPVYNRPISTQPSVTTTTTTTATPFYRHTAPPAYHRPPPRATTTTTTEKVQTIKYNPQYYNPNAVTPNPNPKLNDDLANLPISDALKMLLKPYMKENVTKIDSEKLEAVLEHEATEKTDTNKYGSELDVLVLPSPHTHYQNKSAALVYPSNYHSFVPRTDFQTNRWTPMTAPPQHQPRFVTKNFVPTTTATTTTTTARPTTVPPVPCAGKFDCGNGNCVERQQVCNGKDNCGNRADENKCDHIGYEVRLSNNLGVKHEGRIEMKVYNKWGYICDDNFGMVDADVLCKELGFSLGANEVRPNSYYPPHTSMLNGSHVVFIMDEVDCKGNETSLRHCDFRGWGIHDCNSEEVAGVACKIPVMACPPDYWLCDTSMECIPTGFLCDNVHDCADESDESVEHCNAPLQFRLQDGPSNKEGRVEIKYRGIWGTVCDDDFGDKEAKVVCRALGFNGTAQVKKNTYGQGKGQIWLDQVSCVGNETNLDSCVHWQWGEHNCGHTEDVGVKCDIAPSRKAASRPNSRMLNLDFVEKSSKILPDQCGIVKVPKGPSPSPYGFKVVHGTETVRGHHPWQASIRAKKQVKSVHWCGAVLVSRYHILTAAHCLIGYPKGSYLIRLGDHNTETLESSEIDVFIENTYIHEDFRKGQHMNNDIAVILLKTPIRFNEYVQPVCMPTKEQRYTPGMNCVISGWGSVQSGSQMTSYNLRAGVVPIQPENVCKKPEVYGSAITDGMFCAGTLDEGVDACDGDSGGPLVCANNNVHTLYGIISWGQHCGYANKPGVYVKVAHYLEWIEQKLNHSMHHFGV